MEFPTCMCEQSVTARALRTLHYNAKWLEFGLLDEQFLHQQLSEYEKGPDTNIEHYRYAAFQRILANAEAHLRDEAIDQYIELAQLDEDRDMAQAALSLLVRFRGLTDQQLQRITEGESFGTPVLQNLTKRVRLLRELDSPSISKDLFDRCMAVENAEVQRKLLQNPSLSKEQIETLMTRGSNRAVRNLAKNRLLKWLPR